MGSSRLRGKSMMELAGAPLVGRMLERVKRCRSLDHIVLATTRKDEDDVLEGLVAAHGVRCFRGSENDLVDRYYEAAKELEVETVVRLPGDNPCPEPGEIDRIVGQHLAGSAAFSSNLAEVYGNGYPDGIGAEVIRFDALEAVWRLSVDPEKREHVHLNFFDYRAQRAVDPTRYRVQTVECPSEFRRPDLVLDVNTLEDYVFMRSLYEYLYPRNRDFDICDIIDWYDRVYCPEHGPRGKHT